MESKNRAALYKYINTRVNHNIGVGFLEPDDGSMVISDFGRASSLADVFANVYAHIRPVAAPLLHDTSCPVMEDSVWFDHRDIFELLPERHSCSSVALDGIPSQLIIIISSKIPYPLEYFFKLIFCRGEISDRWIHALVILILKRSPDHDQHNYRP